MTKRNLFGFTVELDETATRQWYASAGAWDCDCGDCRNFLALARARRLPAFVLEPLDRLGIPPEKATYVCRLFPDANGQYYQFSYRVAGRILSGEATADHARCWHEPYPCGAPGFPEPHFDLAFDAVLPWVSGKENEDHPSHGETRQINLDCQSYATWKCIMAEKLKSAARFEIHCWEDEAPWYRLALRYGTEKETGWRGKIVAGPVTPAFCDMLLNLAEPSDKEIVNKFTPFFSIFLDNGFSSEHYGTEITDGYA